MKNLPIKYTKHLTEILKFIDVFCLNFCKQENKINGLKFHSVELLFTHATFMCEF